MTPCADTYMIIYGDLRLALRSGDRACALVAPCARGSAVVHELIHLHTFGLGAPCVHGGRLVARSTALLGCPHACGG